MKMLPDKCCAKCAHFEYEGKLKVDGWKMGRCNHGKPLLHNGRFNQFDDAGTNCPCFTPNAPADFAAVAGKVRRDVGQEQEVDRG